MSPHISSLASCRAHQLRPQPTRQTTAPVRSHGSPPAVEIIIGPPSTLTPRKGVCPLSSLGRGPGPFVLASFFLLLITLSLHPLSRALAFTCDYDSNGNDDCLNGGVCKTSRVHDICNCAGTGFTSALCEIPQNCTLQPKVRWHRWGRKKKNMTSCFSGSIPLYLVFRALNLVRCLSFLSPLDYYFSPLLLRWPAPASLEPRCHAPVVLHPFTTSSCWRGWPLLCATLLIFCSTGLCPHS